MSSTSGIRDGDFDRLTIVQDLGVGQDQNFGTSGQVLTSGGEGEELFWGTNSATLPQGLVAGTNITFTPAGTYNGSVETTISATDTNTEYTGTAPIDISVSDVISLNKDATLTTISDNLSVVKVPNTLTITDSAGTSVVFDGSATTSITINDDDTTYQAGTGISIDTSTDPDTINCSNIPNTALANFTISGISLGSNLANLTAGTNISFDVGTTYNGSSAIIISANDTDTTYQAGTGISIDTSTDPDTINCSNIPNTALANFTISGISLGSNLANLTAGTNISFDVGTTYNGSTAITISATDTDTGITDLNEGDGINITSISATEKTISANIDSNTLEFKTDTLGAPEPKEIAVKKVPNDLTFTGFRTGTYNGGGVLTIDLDDIPNSALTNSTISGKELGTNLSNLVAGTNITFSVGTTYDGSQEIIISSADDTTLNLIEGNGISIASSGADRTISVNADGTTLSNNVGSGKAGVLKVPYDLQTDCRMLNFRSGSTYNGIALRQLYINTQVRRRVVFPTIDTTYDIYRRIKVGGYPNTSDTMYPIDTNFNLTNVPNIRPVGGIAPYGYKVTISFTMLVDTATQTGDGVYLRVDSSNNYISGWTSPVFISGGQDSGGSNQGHHRHHATFVVSATATTTTFDIYPVIAVYNTSGTNDSRTNTPRITYGRQFGNLVMDITPLEVYSINNSSNPFTIPPASEDDY